MKRRSALILVFGLTALAAAPARADIVDIRAEEDGDRARILFLFDSQPADASITVQGAEAQGTIAGVHDSGQVVRPGAGALDQISVADRRLGVAIGAMAARPILSAEAQVFRDSVLFELELEPAPASPAPVAVAEADPEPAEPPAPSGVPEARLVAPGTVGAEPEAPDMAMAEPEPVPDTGIELPPEPEPEPAPEPVQLAEAEPEPAPPVDLQPAVQDPEPEPAHEVAPRGDPALPPPSAPGPASELLAARLDRAACDAAQETVAADPWALDSLFDHGACLARSGQGARAQEVFERLATFDPDSTRALVALGALRQDAGDRGGAEAYYQRAMDAGPGDGEATLIRILREGM